MTEKTDIRATIELEPPFNGLQFKVFFNPLIYQFQGFEVSNFSIQFPKFNDFPQLNYQIHCSLKKS
jgi:hypothetical protein